MRLSGGCCSIGIDSVENLSDARVPQNEVGGVYDKIAGVYDVWGTLTESRARKRAIELAAIQDGEEVLEVAVGTGLAFVEIVKRNPRGNNIGIDLSQGMLERARERLRRSRGTNYRLEAGTAFDLQLREGSIDVLLNNYMFDLIPFQDMDKVLGEFNRVLKKDGRLVLVNMTEGERFGSGLYNRIYRWSPKTMGGCRGVQLSDRLKQNGFRIVVREYHQQMLFPSEVILAIKQ